MPTTANFSLEYPDDNSSVDIAGHFETLADDVDEAINTRLALTGGTLTGSLSGTSLSLSSTLSVTGTSTLTGDLTISKSSPVFTISAGASAAISYMDSNSGHSSNIIMRTGTSNRWTIQKSNTSESGSNAGSDFALIAYNDAGAFLSTPLTITRSTGLTTLSSLTVSGVSSFTGASSFTGQMSLVNGVPATVKFAKASQWGYSSGYRAIVLGDTAGSPNNVTVSIGYDPVGNANGSFTGDGREVLFRNAVEFTTPNAANNAWLKPLKFDSTGNSTMLGLTLTGDLTVSKTSPSMVVTGSGLSQLQITSTASNYAQIELSRAAGQWGATFVRTGSTLRWGYGVNGDAESGANAGSNFVFYTYNDAGGYLGNPITITRSTGAVTLTGTLNGKVVNDIVTGPASATDNALVRFDGTTGKVVQNSGITVDDSGYVSSDLTVSKASPVFHVTASSGNATFKLTGAAGTSRDFFFYSGTTLRWAFRVNSSAESGSNAGSNFTLSAYNDAGDTLLGNYLSLTRAEGRLTLSQAGATAGLELGASGPRVMSGTGSPEGVVTAPIGSQWIDTAATTGAVKWLKATGAGNTGWVVEYGDTGVRNIKASLENSWSTYAGTDPVYLRRVGNVVQLDTAGIVGTTSSSATFYTLPVGFRPSATLNNFFANYTGAGPSSNGLTIVGSDGTCLLGGTRTLYTSGRFFASWFTSNAWPASLPGSAA